MPTQVEQLNLLDWQPPPEQMEPTPPPPTRSHPPPSPADTWQRAKANYYLAQINRVAYLAISDPNPKLQPMRRETISRLHSLRNEALSKLTGHQP